MSDEHLSTEEVSALLDRGAGEASGSGHLQDCAACRREMELLRRMRMALSAMDDREAPPGAWASLEEELERREITGERYDEDRPEPAESILSVADVGWVRAAAAAVLFVGGLGLGTHLASPGGADAGDGAEAATTSRTAPAGEAAGDAPAEAGSDGPAATTPSGGESSLAAAGEGTTAEGAAGSDGLSYREAMERLEELRAQGPTFREAYRNPRAAAEHLARLDALMQASREALREDPADPALNDFLFQVAEERESLNRALQLSSLEYR